MPAKKIYRQRNAPTIVGHPVFDQQPFKLKNQGYHIWDEFLNQKRIKIETTN